MISRSKWFRIIVLNILLLAILCSPALIAAQGRSQDEANCTATPDQILGQAFGGFAGAAGEIGENGFTPEGEDIVAEGLVAEVDWIMENLRYSDFGPERVAILIVDDFSSTGTESRDSVASHGWLVNEVFEQLHAELPEDAARNIILEQVNIADENGYQSELVISALEEAVNRLAEEGVERFVVNMSFVIIPCQDEDLNFDFGEFLSRREDNRGHSIVSEVGGDTEYVQELLQDSRVTYIEEDGLNTEEASERVRGRSEEQQERQGGQPEFVQQRLQFTRLFENPQLNSDPLRDFFRSTDYLIVPIASAGNFKWRRPFFPARWPEVLSVSATEDSDLRFWLHSNNGEVTVPGAWYLFDDGVYRAGTSFAAPVLSMMSAIDLTQATPTCGVRGNSPNLTHGNYDNMLLLEAVDRRC